MPWRQRGGFNGAEAAFDRWVKEAGPTESGDTLDDDHLRIGDFLPDFGGNLILR